jgi:DNA repair exonuclease SbcCD ATPase subunit
MISIDTIEIRNFLGFADYVTKLSLNKYLGIASIIGKYDEDEFTVVDDEKRIGAGKSSISEAIVWCLFGHLTYLEKPADAVINWHTGKNCFVRIITTDGYEIIRTRRMVGSNELVIIKDGEDLTRSTTTPSQDFLNNTFKIDYRSFVTSVIFGQFNEGFLSVSDAKRRSIFERFIKITSFNSIAATAKEKVTKLNEDISVLESKIDGLNSSKKSLETEIEGLVVKIKEFDDGKVVKIDGVKNALMVKKADIDKKIVEVKSKIASVNEQIKNFIMSDVDDIKSQWSKYEQIKAENDKNILKKSELNQLKSKFEIKLNNVINDIKNSTTELNSYSIVDEVELAKSWTKFNLASGKLPELRADLDKVNSSMRDLKYDAKKLKDDIENITNIKEFQVCPKCLHNITEEHVCSIINDKSSKVKLLDPQIVDLDSRKTKLSEAITKLESVDEPEMTVEKLKDNIAKVTELNSKIEILNASKIKITAGIKDIDNQIKSIEVIDNKKPEMTIEDAKDQLVEYNSLKKDVDSKDAEIVKLNSDFKNAILETQTKINEIKNSENPYSTLVSNKKSQVNDFSLEIAKQQEELSKQRKIKVHVDYIRDSYYNKKKMRAFWISEIVPTFNKFIKYYFNLFEIEDKVEFDEFLNVKVDRWGYKTHSGGEKKRIDLSIMFALNDLHVSVFGPQCNLMVLDEVDGRIDPFTTNRLIALLNDDMIKRGNGLTNIFVISHKEKMKDRFPNQIIVKNKGGNSYIVEQ